jgi:hypothetical protein
MSSLSHLRIAATKEKLASDVAKERAIFLFAESTRKKAGRNNSVLFRKK